jgi:hypothetical protein
MRIFVSLALVFLASYATAAPLLYEADFSQVVSIDHTNDGSNPIESSPQAGANFTIGYTGSPASDTTRNFFETDGDSLISSDFGGDHFMRSASIDVRDWNEVVIDILADFVGVDSFNNSPQEFIEYIFALDGGAENQFFFFTDDPNGSDLNASTIVDVTGVSALTVGLNANVNGAGDGFDMTSLIVKGTNAVGAAPVPSTLALFLLGAFMGVLRARAAREHGATALRMRRSIPAQPKGVEW